MHESSTPENHSGVNFGESVGRGDIIDGWDTVGTVGTVGKLDDIGFQGWGFARSHAAERLGTRKKNSKHDT